MDRRTRGCGGGGGERGSGGGGERLSRSSAVSIQPAHFVPKSSGCAHGAATSRRGWKLTNSRGSARRFANTGQRCRTPEGVRNMTNSSSASASPAASTSGCAVAISAPICMGSECVSESG